MARTAGPGMGEWVRSVEDASLRRSHPGRDEAAARFDALATPARKMALVREVVLTRAGELTLAYRNVVMVTAGYKSRVDAHGVEQVHPEPCLIFVVKRKWAAGTRGTAGQALPARVLTFGSDNGERVLYAVPTDVQPARRFFGGVARTAACVRVDDPVPGFRLPGTLTCGVRLSGAQLAVGGGFALSAMHVLSPAPTQPLPAGGAAFTAVGGAAAVRGHSTPWGGHIDAASTSGFDAQLAQVADTAWFTQAFGGITLAPPRPYVVAPDVFDDLAATTRFQILAPANHPKHIGQPREPMLAQFTTMAHEEMPLVYEVRRAGRLDRVFIRHRELIMLQVFEDCPAPESGDSGAAVISWWPDGSTVLVGMFIGSGNDAARRRVAYVIPAWRMFDPAEWSRLPAGTLGLTPSFTLP